MLFTEIMAKNRSFKFFKHNSFSLRKYIHIRKCRGFYVLTGKKIQLNKLYYIQYKNVKLSILQGSRKV